MFKIGGNLKGSGVGKYTYYVNGVKASSGFFFIFEWFFIFMLIFMIEVFLVEKLSTIIGKKIWKKDDEQNKQIIILSIIAIILSLFASINHLAFGIKGMIRFKALRMGITKPVLLAMCIGIIITIITIIGIINFIKSLKKTQQNKSKK